MENLLALLQSTLEADPNARLSAELALAQLSTQSGSFHLVALTLSFLTADALWVGRGCRNGSCLGEDRD
jgi:hypothetical protein